jgi:hypothetical protein
MFSMNIDSALCFSAVRAGIEEVYLPARIYHIEHAAGSGFTPEGQQKLWARLRERGIEWLDSDTLYECDRQMRRLGATMIFNRRDLPETELAQPASDVASEASGASK